ncbi:MAG TPA: MFS transporter [Candidatus Kapabacteria bacterium]|nr:MFS transporter [Candidatus Kapabacteria bacterium]
MSSSPDASTLAAATGSRPWILAATIIGSSMAYIDGSVVNVAMPVLQRDFGVRIDQVQWVVEAYTLFVASLILIGGTLGDRYGRRRIYAAGVALYSIASVWCGLAPNVDQLILARVLQGIGGAMLVPGSLAIITSCFSDEERGKAIGTWSGLSAVSTAIGPLLGGWLVDNISWRGVFFINVPLGALVLLLLYRHVPESSDPDAPKRLDWTGAALAATGLGSLVFGLIQANTLGARSPIVLGSCGGGILLLAAFIWVQAHTAAPMMPLKLFRSREFAATNILTLLLYAALGGMMFFLGFNLIQVQGYSATATGAALLPFIILISTLSRWAGGLATRHGPRLPLVLGPVVAAGGFALLTLPSLGGSYWSTFFPGIAGVGLGMAITVAPLTATVMGSVAPHHAGTASGINNAVSWLASLLAIALLGLVAVDSFRGKLETELMRRPLSQAYRTAIAGQSAKLAQIELPAAMSREEAAAAHAAIDVAYIGTFRIVMFWCAGLALASGLLAGAVLGTGKRLKINQQESGITNQGLRIPRP